ncbi:Apyrase, partial [Operophtera brumata]
MGWACNPTAEPCIGGFARLTTMVRERLAAEPQSLLLNGGDSFQGTIWYNILRWNVLGNHEFDNGIEGVVPYLQHLDAPVVTANIIDDDEPTIQGLYEHSIVVERQGRKIGIIGVIIASTDTLAASGDLKFADEVETVKAEAEKLNAEGVDIIIVLSHCGLDIDRDIALNGGPYIDIIVGGHSHSLLYNDEVPVHSAFVPEGSYPIVVDQPDKKVLIVQAAAHTQYLGEIKLFFDDAGNLLEWQGHPHYIGNHVEQAPDILAIINQYLPIIEEQASEEIGSSMVELASNCFCNECNVGSFLCDAFLHAVLITFESVILAVPFENNIEVFDLRGDHIMEMLEYSVANDPWPGARMLQVSVRCIDCDVPRYEPLQLDKYYKVVTQTFMGEGGDGFSMVSNNRKNVEVVGVDYDIVMDYIRQQSPVFAEVDGLSFVSSQERFPVNILHYNDFHARFVQTSPLGGVCNPTAAPCIGGFARLATMVLGNHEFDNGIEGVVPYLQHLEAPVVTANIIDDDEPTIQGLYEHSIVVERQGRKIGIIGVIIASTDTLAATGDLKFTDEVETVKAEAEKLNAEGVNIIIVLSHCGLDIDREIALNGGPFIDIIVGGHSHTLLYNDEAPIHSAFVPQGPYPVIVEQSERKVLIVQAAAHTQYLGEIKLFFDDAGNLLEWQGNPHYIGTDIEQAADVLAKIDQYLPMIEEMASEEIGSSMVNLASNCACSECNLGSFLCDAFMHGVMHWAEEDNWHYAHFCVINQGGIRSSIEHGTITFESTILAVPFENNVEVFDLRGDHIMEMLEYSVANDPYAGARMLQVSGIRSVFDGARPLGERVLNVTVRCIECSVPRYEPINLDKYYKVMTTDFIGNGGGDYTNVEVVGVDYDIVMNYIRQQSPVFAEVDGRIQISNPCIV